MLGYCPIPLYPNSIYMIVLNVLHSPRRKLRMKLQPHLPVQCDCSPPPLSSSLPSLPHPPPPLPPYPSPLPSIHFSLSYPALSLPPSSLPCPSLSHPS